MSSLLRQNRAPADVTAVLAAEEAQRFAGVGRNDPCPCDSGRKFKMCHGAASSG
jgi:preprotein translocase subunit SecA